MKQLTILAFICTLLCSCYTEPAQEDRIVTGLKPIYLHQSEVGEVESTPAKPFIKLGKIVSSGDFIYINEQFEGIHVINNENPSTPQAVYFWKIKGNIDFTIDGSYLYADDSFNLLTIDISDPSNLVLLSKIENIYLDGEGNTSNSSLFPDDHRGSFECVESELGIVIEWQLSQLTNPKCRI